MWQPSRDVDELLDEYYTNFFGEAAQPMRKYFETLERAWDTPREGHWFEGFGNLREQFAVISPEVMAKCRPHLQQAADQADSKRTRQRVEFFTKGFNLANAFVAENAACEEGTDLLQTDSSPQQLREAAERVNKARQARLAIWDRLKDDPMQTWYHRACFPPKWSKFEEWLKHSRKVQARLEFGALQAEAESGSTTLERAARKALEETEDPQVALSLRGQLFLSQGSAMAANLLKNPGFDEVGHSSKQQVPQDWIQNGTPPNWSAWTHNPDATRFEWCRNDGRSGGGCVLIEGTRSITRSADYIQKVPVEGGESYVARTYVKGHSASGRATVFLWVDVSGGESVSEVYKVGADTNGWHELVVTFTAPPEASRATVWLGMNNFSKGDRAIFDDALLARVP